MASRAALSATPVESSRAAYRSVTRFPPQAGGCLSLAGFVLGDGQVPHGVRKLKTFCGTELPIEGECFRVAGFGLVHVAEFLLNLTEVAKSVPQSEWFIETAEDRHDLLVMPDRGCMV